MANKFYTANDFEEPTSQQNARPERQVYTANDFEPDHKLDGLDYVLQKAGMTLADLKNSLYKNVLTNESRPGIGNAIERGGPASLGALVGTPLGPIGMGLGAAAGEGIRQGAVGINAMLGNTQAPSAGKVGAGMAAQGVSNTLLGGAIGLMGSKTGIRTGAQLIRAGSGVSEETGKQVLNKLSLLFGSKTAADAGSAMGKAAEEYGLKTGGEGFEQVFGSRFYKPDLVIKAADMAEEAMSSGNIDPQALFSARQMITKGLQQAKYRQPIEAANQRELLSTLSRIDDTLGSSMPKMMSAISDYRKAMVNEAFSSLLPVNLNSTVSKLGMAAGGGILGRDALANRSNPEHLAADLVLMSMFSPFMVGNYLRGVASGIPEAYVRSGVGGGASMLSNVLSGQQNENQ